MYNLKQAPKKSGYSIGQNKKFIIVKKPVPQDEKEQKKIYSYQKNEKK